MAIINLGSMTRPELNRVQAKVTFPDGDTEIWSVHELCRDGFSVDQVQRAFDLDGEALMLHPNGMPQGPSTFIGDSIYSLAAVVNPCDDEFWIPDGGVIHMSGVTCSGI